jgi:hypothetical protein
MHATRSAIEGLAKYLRLPSPDRFSQDWEYEVADSSKVAEWLTAYGSGQLNPEESSVLLNMIIASYNDAIGEGSARPEDWDAIARYLLGDRSLHEATINYWALPDEIELDNCFPITPLMRQVRACEGGNGVPKGEGTSRTDVAGIVH